MKTVLAAVDFSDMTQKIVNQAARLANNFSCSVHIVHVAAPNPDKVGYDVSQQYVRDYRAKEYRREHQELHQHAERIKEMGIEVIPLLIQGPVVEVILKEADKIQAGVIVLGSHGHGMLHKMLAGSVCEGVLKCTTIPLFIIPPKKR
ncbi:MAG: universal stress protein [Magnetococcales bacterium]|nr:universal stress protein [Magnetococcales bacterium]